MTIDDRSLHRDNDWMLCRELGSASDPEPDDFVEGEDLAIDPRTLEKRRQRKLRLSPNPSGSDPLLHIDQAVSKHCPEFSEPMWTLGAVARWVAERTSEAVDGLSISQEKLRTVLPEIQQALAAGEICACAITFGDPIPRDLPAATWSIYDLALETENGLVRIFPCNTGTASYDEALLHLRVRRDAVLEGWPARTNRRVVKKTTIAAENECRRWLCEMMRHHTERPNSKSEIRKEARAKFPRLGERGFGRAWQDAIRETGAVNWAAPGRPAACD